MKFIVIEIKDKDLFTIYDVEHKGVCCCSAYTLKQLLSDHNEVLGCQVVNGKLNVFECDLDGNKRSRKASNCCTDTTKRSAVTIEKGLDEAHYPRLKTERKLDTTALKNETRKIKGVDLHINDVKRFDLYLSRLKLNLYSNFKQRSPADCKFLQNILTNNLTKQFNQTI